MKALSAGLVLVVLATGISIAGTTAAATWQDLHSPSWQAQATTEEVSVPVALPDLATIKLKGGDSMSGRITVIDSQKLSLQRGSDTRSIPLSQVEMIEFDKSAVVYRTNGGPILRGDGEEQSGVQHSWPNILVSELRMLDPIKGQAVVRLNSGLPKWKIKEILAIAHDRQYVVDAIELDSQAKTMTIRVTPYSK